MCSLVLFTCNECRVRFPAWKPDDVPEVELQVVHACSNVVAQWDEDPENVVEKRLALRCSGLCLQCHTELLKVKEDPVLSGVTRFGAGNFQDPLSGFPGSTVVELTQLEMRRVFAQATVLEAMLVSLNHMQVSVCTFTTSARSRTGLPNFRKNIISFPQKLSDLQQHLAFVSSLAANDIVNVRVPSGTDLGGRR